MIIGLSGTNCAGKGTVAKDLVKRGFYYSSLSDVVREEAGKRKLRLGRENLIAVGNDLRKSFGNRVIAERVLNGLDRNKNQVVDSFRNPAEVKAFKEAGEFFLFFVDAPVEERFKRGKKRKQGRDAKSLKEFKRLERRELGGKDSSGQQLLKCKKMADYLIVNNGSKKELVGKIEKVLGKIPKNFKRPSWDEYFMNIADVVASRSNCVKRKVAALIVKDRRIISTGYNGTPRGAKNCSDGGCPRCNSFGESGKHLEECYCSHAEENAIVQASYHGISVKDSTIYSTFCPCLLCTKMIINAGIKKVVFNADYPLNESSKKLFKQAKVELKKLK